MGSLGERGGEPLLVWGYLQKQWKDLGGCPLGDGDAEVGDIESRSLLIRIATAPVFFHIRRCTGDFLRDYVNRERPTGGDFFGGKQADLT